MSSLPIELVEEIIDHLANSNSKQDLRSCALVCKQWLSRSRAWIFHSLSTCPTSPTYISEPFLEATHNIQSSPHLVSLVKKIKVDCCHVPELTRITFNTLNLAHLSCLWLCRNDFARFGLDISLTRTLSSSLDTLIIDQTVFRDVCQLLHFLSSPCFKALRSLTLTDVSYMRSLNRDLAWIMRHWAGTTSLQLPIIHKIKLQNCTVGLIPDHNIFDVLFHPDSPFDWTSLRRMTFSRIWDNKLIQGFLSGPLPALTSIKFEHTQKHYRFANSGAFTGINPSVLLNLNELAMGFDFSVEDIDIWSQVVETLESREMRSLLKFICIIFPPWLFQLGTEGFKNSEESDQISTAATLFHKLAKLSSVRRLRLIIQLHLDISNHSRMDVEKFCSSRFLSTEYPQISLVFRQGDTRRNHSLLR